MGNRKLKTWVKVVLVVALALIIGGVAFGVTHVINQSSSDDKLETVESESSDKKSETESSSKVAETESSTETIKGYVNTFGGYTSLFAANGGNTTQEGSQFDQKGLNIEITIEDDDSNIIEAFENGEIQFFAMTINKMSLVAKQLEDEGIETVIPYLIDTSTGGDGIVTDSSIQTITDLQNAKIGMAKESVSTAIPVWFLNESGLSEDEVQNIVDNFVLFDSTQEAVEAFVNGEIEAVSTWNMTGALEKEGSHILFSTTSGEYLVIDGIVFEKSFAEEHQSEIVSMIDAIITTVNDINSGNNVSEYYDAIRSAVPDFESYSDDDITDEISYAKFLGFSGNISAFEVATDIYKDFCKIWEQLGYETDETYELIDESYVMSLGSKWDNQETETTDSTVDAEEYVNSEALISQYVNILFNGDSAEFKTGYEETDKQLIEDFVKVAKVLNKTVIKISGRVNLGYGSSVWDETTQSYKIADGFTSSEFAYKLSLMRAETVKEYMVAQGIDESRIIVEGLGGDSPIDTNDTDEGQANNRSCQISFYQAGY